MTKEKVKKIPGYVTMTSGAEPMISGAVVTSSHESVMVSDEVVVLDGCTLQACEKLNARATLEKIICFIRKDVEGCLKGGVNMSFALILCAYTEFFGHCLTNAKGSECAYEAWLRYMGSPYSTLLNNNVDLYDRVRCGLIHEYAIKGGANIFTCDNHPGIEIICNRIFFNNKQYAKDLDTSIEKYLNALNTDEDLKKILQAWLNRKKIVVI